jgi:hypothetical protein
MTAKTSTLAELERLEREALKADAATGLLRQAEQDALAEVAAAHERVEAYHRGLAAGDDPNEGRLRKLTAEANRLASAVVMRPQSGGKQIERHVEVEARIAASERNHWALRRAVRDYAAEHRDELEAELVERALETHRALMEAFDALRAAARDHRAAGDAFGHIGILATGRAPTDLPRPAPMPSDIRGQAADVAPPIPSHALTAEVVEAITETQPVVGDQLARVVADREQREQWLERRKAREAQRDADRPAAA